jgi:NhaA family Na+:H+ antiporter
MTARRPFSMLREFLDSEASGGVLLMMAAALAMAVANSPARTGYFEVLHAPLAGMGVLDWINDGLMAVFFLLVGLEIKREIVHGQLSTWPRRILPGVAALGGMIVPAVIYFALNRASPEAVRGWAISSATDIAFALGVISLLGARVPASLKVFLAALAILDDLGAVLIIALFYSAELSPLFLTLSGLTLGALFLLNRLRVDALSPYILLGALLWWFVLHSGLHATLAGVALALAIPIRAAPSAPDTMTSPLHRLEHRIAPWVAFVIIPVFGFANAGVVLGGVEAGAFLAPAPLGAAAGLFFGKQLGVFLSSWSVIRSGWADLPAAASWAQLYGVALLSGIGFTMSLFIGDLAFRETPRGDEVKLAVFAGSLISAALGLAVLALASRRARYVPPAPLPRHAGQH